MAEQQGAAFQIDAFQNNAFQIQVTPSLLHADANTIFLSATPDTAFLFADDNSAALFAVKD